jgi:transcriptional regulator with XRE-family HTH domain
MTKLINHYQLKIAKGILNLGVRDIGKLLNVNKSTVSNAELGKTRDFFYKNSAALIDFFTKNNISFPTEYSIRCNEKVISLKSTDIKNITRFQLKSARLLLSLSQRNLAKEICVTERVIIRFESIANNQFINPKNPLVINRLLDLFKNAGIYFPDETYVFFKEYMDNTTFN